VATARELEQALKDAGVQTEFEFYEGAGHAFFNDLDRLGTYDKDAAERSWQRTIAFLRSNLSG
jgi:carboxymethylenebutenolidase